MRADQLHAEGESTRADQIYVEGKGVEQPYAKGQKGVEQLYVERHYVYALYIFVVYGIMGKSLSLVLRLLNNYFSSCSSNYEKAPS